MNLILLFPDDFIDGGKRVCLSDRRHKHIRNICRASVNDELTVGLCGGDIGTGCIEVINDRMLEMAVSFHSSPPSALPVTLILALPRPIMLKRIMATVSSIGVKRIILFHSHRVEKSFWKSPVLNEESLRTQFILGLEQGRDTVLPTVELKPLFKPFVEDELPDIARKTLSLIAHPGASEPCPCGVKRRVTLIIGPEGGFIPYEIGKFADLGFMPVCLGERILRVESAVPALLSRLF